MTERFDATVIGSGFGGTSLACRLAQARRSVCVLERGRGWSVTDVPRSPSQVARDGFWNVDDRRFGIMEYRAFKQMHVIQGSGVGGGSLHYFNVHIRPPASIFKHPRWPKRVKLNLLKPYYDLAREMLDAKPLTPPAGRELPARTVAFQEACRRLGRRPELVPIAVHTGVPRLNPRGAVQQLPCDFSGNCALGCATNAKNRRLGNQNRARRRMYTELSRLRQSMNQAPHIEPTGAEQFPASRTTNGAHADSATARRLPERTSRMKG